MMFYLLIILAVVLYLRFRRRISIAHVRGPPSPSWLYGNWLELFDCPAAETDFRWQDQYGGVVRVRAPLGEDRLFITDPKAIQYIYHTANYRFPKPTGRQAIMRSVFGPGLTTSEGDDHRRARKIMLPGFNGPEARTYLPIFFGAAERLTHKWEDLIASETQQTAVVSIPWWVSRAALDAIGEAAFDYQFGALDNSCNELVDMYTNLFFNVFGIPTTGSILTVGIVDKLAPAVVNFFLKYLPPRRLSHAFEALKISTAVSKKLVEEKTAALLEDKGRRDIFSLLVKANNSEDPETRLEEKELLAQMHTIIVAGHETTANTLSFTLFEMCKEPQIQHRLRAEIRAMGKPTDYTSSDFDNMPYLTAVVKETLRFHPIIYNTFRVPECDEVVPLLDPITLDTGEVLTEVPIAKGTKIITSVAAYNRNKAIFGHDADVFNPDRWLRDDRPTSKVSLGVYANLYGAGLPFTRTFHHSNLFGRFTFAGGSRSCIGWRFAVLELHAFLVQLVGKFEFEFAEAADANDFRREACNLMTPTLASDRTKGSQLPMRIRMARNGVE
ncbi:cytochrome P450 [Hymenopellis radicata]|nr:cytochrome P450 [Hymenopellis radicata]